MAFQSISHPRAISYEAVMRALKEDERLRLVELERRNEERKLRLEAKGLVFLPFKDASPLGAVLEE